MFLIERTIEDEAGVESRPVVLTWVRVGDEQLGLHDGGVDGAILGKFKQRVKLRDPTEIMLTFLFWNLKNARQDLLTSLVVQHTVDVLLLTECPVKPASVLEALNQERNDFYFVPDACPKISIYTRFSDEYFPAHGNGADYSIRKLKVIEKPEILVCIVHFPSKLWHTPFDQATYATNFCEQLESAERDAEHARTVLVGDLNMNPFDDGMVSMRGLHAVATREIATRPLRRVKFDSNPYFFNPMWRHFGEREEGHAGTYYYPSPKARADYWNVYDQVLLRPELLPFFNNDDLIILHRNELTNESFLRTDGIPDAERVSDHLPVLFRLQV